jgi:hypothetical protein
MPEIASSSSDWPLPATPAMPTISPARMSNETSSTMVTPRMSLTVRFLTASLTAPAAASPFSTLSSTRRPTISSASSPTVVLDVFARRHHLAASHHRHRVGDRHDLAQLVRDQDDRLALFLQLPEDAEQMVGLGRRQHAGRLVEDQDFGAAIERLQDLDPLLQADREFLDDGVGIDLETVFAFEALEFGACLGDAALQQRAALGAEHDVFEHGEIVDQHEMLVHHADAERYGVCSGS